MLCVCSDSRIHGQDQRFALRSERAMGRLTFGTLGGSLFFNLWRSALHHSPLPMPCSFFPAQPTLSVPGCLTSSLWHGHSLLSSYLLPPLNTTLCLGNLKCAVGRTEAGAKEPLLSEVVQTSCPASEELSGSWENICHWERSEGRFTRKWASDSLAGSVSE